MPQTWQPTAKAVIAGVRRLLVAAFAADTRLSMTGSPARVSDFAPAATWYAVGRPYSDGCNAAQQQARSTSGNLWQVSASIAFADGLRLYQRLALDSYTTGRYWLLWEDMAGNWWLLGRERGLSATAGSKSGPEQVETLDFIGKEPAAWLAVDAATARGYYAAATAIPDDSDTPVLGGDS